MRVAVIGKGGAGKSMISGTIARILARDGQRVLALDSDPLPGLSLSLGLGPDPEEPPLAGAAERTDEGRWQFRDGLDAVSAAQRFSRDGPDGIRVLQAGKTPPESLALTGSTKAFYEIVQKLSDATAFEGWAMVGDLPAGPRHVAFGCWAPYASPFVAVVQPTAQSALSARRVARIARMREGAEVVMVANRVTGPSDVEHVERLTGERMIAAVPLDADVAQAELLGVAPIDHAPDSPAVREIERLVSVLSGGRAQPSTTRLGASP